MLLAGPRAVALAMALLLGVGLTPMTANAATKGVAQQAVAVGSARYSAVLSATAATATTSGAVSTPTANDSFWWLTNNGTVALSSAASFSLRLTITLTAGSGPVELQMCSTTWDVTNNVCTGGGTITAVASSSAAGNYPLTTPLQTGEAKRLRLHNNALVPFGSTVTVNVSLTHT